MLYVVFFMHLLLIGLNIGSLARNFRRIRLFVRKKLLGELGYSVGKIRRIELAFIWQPCKKAFKIQFK